MNAGMYGALVGTFLLVATGQAACAEPLGTAVAQAVAAGESASQKREPTPEERMNQRYPQPIKVGDLIGLPVLDYDDLTIGHVRNVVRTPAGKIVLVVTHGGWPTGWFGWGARLVPVPIEVVAILGRQLAALDMTREEFATAPTWSSASGVPIAPDEKIRIAITRR